MAQLGCEAIVRPRRVPLLSVGKANCGSGGQRCRNVDEKMKDGRMKALQAGFITTPPHLFFVVVIKL